VWEEFTTNYLHILPEGPPKGELGWIGSRNIIGGNAACPKSSFCDLTNELQMNRKEKGIEYLHNE
jgi:hypothetical protein